MINEFVLDNSKDIIEALESYYYAVGDVDIYIKCLQWINQYAFDKNIDLEIDHVLDFMDYDVEQLLNNEDMSYQIIEALEFHYTYDAKGLDVQLFIETLDEINTYCESNIIELHISTLCREHNLCPIDYYNLIYKCTDEGEFLQCENCGHIIF